jgi:CheY-like chemotaxis protein
MARSAVSQTLGPKRILVVDDDAAVAESLQMMLMLGGHTVQIAADGEQALAVLEQERYDLVITDFYLPGIDGLNLGRAIKERLPGQPVMLLSGMVDRIESDPQHRLHVDYLLPKPFLMEELQAALLEVLVSAET